ncbi:MAG: Vitamin B12 dependent methionine synthase activation subunit [Clostridia bacterium]|nr:Vitamin B12 dependent methionine synthase activation subunit [Clostridia bacterium]
MRSSVFVRSYAPVDFDRNEIFRYAGVKQADSSMTELLEQCLDECRDCFSYNVCYTELPVETDGELTQFGGVATRSKALRTALDGCEGVVVFAATVGIGIDRLIKKYSLTSASRAVMMQAIGAERIESLCDAFCADMGAELSKRGLELRPRFSAGYGDFPLECQRDIFALLDDGRRIGVCLNESLLMSPTKSVTAVIGVRRIKNERMD